MYQIDYAITSFFVRHSFHSYVVYRTIEFVADNDLFKGCFFAVLLWYLWFKDIPGAKNKREHLVVTLITTLLVIGIALGVGNAMPLRPRPFLNSSFRFSFSDANDPYIGNVSSFPSDHAALFISLAVGFLFISRKVGWLAIGYTILFVMLPRLYLGYHYLTDLMGGAVIGAIVSYVANRSKFLLNYTSKSVTPIIDKYPFYFFPILFLITHQIANLFTEAREVLSFLRTFHKFL